MSDVELLLVFHEPADGTGVMEMSGRISLSKQ